MTMERQAAVAMYSAPWVRGARLRAHLGTICSEIFVDDREVGRSKAWRRAQRELFDALALEARALHANAVVNLEVTFDPFAVDGVHGLSGVRLSAEGIAVVVDAPD